MEILAAIALGLGTAGVLLALRRLSGGRIPRGAAPVAAGLAMIGFAIWSDYTWFGRQAAALPEGVVVVRSVAETSSLRPWTWIWPQVTRFAAVNAAGARRNDNLPGQVLADVYLIARHAPAATLPQIIDCDRLRRAELAGAVRFDAEGRPENPHWLPLAADDPLFLALCTDAPAGAPA